MINFFINIPPIMSFEFIRKDSRRTCAYDQKHRIEAETHTAPLIVRGASAIRIVVGTLMRITSTTPRYAEFEIIGAPEIRRADADARYFIPLRDERALRSATVSNVATVIAVPQAGSVGVWLSPGSQSERKCRLLSVARPVTTRLAAWGLRASVLSIASLWHLEPRSDRHLDAEDSRPQQPHGQQSAEQRPTSS